LPLLAKFSFGGGAGAYALLVSAMGIGSIVAALVNGHRGETGGRVIAAAALAFGIAALAAAAMPDLLAEAVVLAALGAAAVIFVSSVNSPLPPAATPEPRAPLTDLFP